MVAAVKLPRRWHWRPKHARWGAWWNLFLSAADMQIKSFTLGSPLSRTGRTLRPAVILAAEQKVSCIFFLFSASQTFIFVSWLWKVLVVSEAAWAGSRWKTFSYEGMSGRTGTELSLISIERKFFLDKSLAHFWLLTSSLCQVLARHVLRVQCQTIFLNINH